ncbi:MAG: hypothetical protein Q9210_002992 [Variospora velana]
MVLAGIETAEAAGSITNLLFSLSLIFCGYLVSGMLSVGLANARITCSPEEFLYFSPLSLSNCASYLGPYMEERGGYLRPDSMNSTTECIFCSGSETNIFLEDVSAVYGDRWRNLGIFNVGAAVGLYWLARVPKGKREKE